MKITPERALELADELTRSSVLLGCLPEHTGYCGGVYVIDDFERDEIVAALEAATAILRHYAEIAPKWQAVLDAEPAAVVCNPGAFVKIDWTAEPVTTCQPFRESDRVVQLQDGVPVGTQLIIKPAP